LAAFAATKVGSGTAVASEAAKGLAYIEFFKT